MKKCVILAVVLLSFPLLSCREKEALSPEKEEFEPKKELAMPIVSSDAWNTQTIDIEYIQPNRKLISFTFDDAPSHYLENLLAVFASYNEENPDCKATATVFFNGKKFSQDSFSLLHACSAVGFELGNHTYCHYDLTALSAESLRQEIDRTDELLQQIDGKKRHLFRAPYGKTNELVKQTVQVPIINWTIDTLDWTKISEESIYKSVINNLFDGAVVLMHDGYENTLSAVKRLLPDLKQLGYQVVSVSALAKAHSVTMKNGSTYIRLRKGR